MHLIKVSAINSTNSFGREMFRENPAMPLTCIWAKRQLEGRGQRGTVWSSQAGKNLTFSIIFPRPKIEIAQQFLLSAAVATAIITALQKFSLPELKLKWPNDIMSANKKIGGILIENVIADATIAASVIGVGLNVNQKDFEGLPGASSMLTSCGRKFDLDEVLTKVLQECEAALTSLKGQNSEAILKAYKNHLFRRQVPSTFQLPDETYFSGLIWDVTATGKLLVKTEEEFIREFDLKEVKLCF